MVFTQKKKMLAILLMVVFLCAGCLYGCGDKDKKAEQKQQTSQEAKATEYPVKWTEKFDDNEESFEVKSAPKKAVSMSQVTTEMMLALGLEKQMAGTAFLEEEIFPALEASYKAVPVLAEKWPSYEKLMSVKPDFVTGWPVPFTKRGIEHSQITAENVPIFIPESLKDPKADLETNFNDLLKFGEIFDKQANAEKYVAKQRKKLKEVKGKLKKLPQKTVFVFDSEDGDPFTVFEGYTTNILKEIGCKNILSGKGSDQTWGKATWEQVVAEDPDYILVVDYGVSIRNNDDFNKKVEALKNNPVLKDMKAIKNENFVKVKLSEITPGVRTVDALTKLAETIHGVKIK